MDVVRLCDVPTCPHHDRPVPAILLGFADLEQLCFDLLGHHAEFFDVPGSLNKPIVEKCLLFCGHLLELQTLGDPFHVSSELRNGWLAFLHHFVSHFSFTLLYNSLGEIFQVYGKQTSNQRTKYWCPLFGQAFSFYN